MTVSEHTGAAGQTFDTLPSLSIPVLSALVAAKIALHIPGLFRYGYFRDELYFLDCARHLDWGYVDHAPLVAIYAKIALLLGASLPALRVLPILAGVAVVVLTVLIARQLGGDAFAQALAGIAIVFAPVSLMIDSILSMNAFEPVFWMGCVWVLIRIVRTGDSRLWLLFGALAGLGLENKHSTLFFGAAVAVAILATPLRRELLRPWIWLGAADRGGAFPTQPHLAVAARLPDSRGPGKRPRHRQERRTRSRGIHGSTDPDVEPGDLAGVARRPVVSASPAVGGGSASSAGSTCRCSRP